MEDRKTNRGQTHSKFEHTRDSFDTYQEQLYEEYVRDLATNSKNDPKSLW